MSKVILRIFGYLYHLVLGLFLLGIGGLALFSQSDTLRLEVLPMEEPALTYWVFFGSLAGLISLVLAMRGKTRLLFRLWALVVLVLMAYGYFFTRYGFHSPGDFAKALLLTLGALAAVVGSWTRPPRRAY